MCSKRISRARRFELDDYSHRKLSAGGVWGGVPPRFLAPQGKFFLIWAIFLCISPYEQKKIFYRAGRAQEAVVLDQVWIKVVGSDDELVAQDWVPDDVCSRSIPGFSIFQG
jgi:hypothetical protein